MVQDIVQEHGTPAYIYSRKTLERHWRAFDEAFSGRPHLICYSVKACSNIAILNILAKLGSGFDIVSIGELERVLAAGGQADKVVFSGVGKRVDEMKRALQVGIRCFNVESLPELERLNQVAAELDRIANISIRVNPDVDAKTHPYISTGLKENKFGISIDQAEYAYEQAVSMKNIAIEGIDCHIGSQLTELAPLMDSLQRLISLAERLHKKGIAIRHLDLGGGLGVRYQDETPPLPALYTETLYSHPRLKDYEVLIEPGRAIVANAAILVTCVEYLKHGEEKNFAIVDAAMNDLLRPALYGSWQDVVPLIQKNATTNRSKVYDVVGPICETADFLAKDRSLNIESGDYLAVRTSGAYCFTMSSNYNSRPRAIELLVDGSRVHVIRPREEVASLFANEVLLPEDGVE